MQNTQFKRPPGTPRNRITNSNHLYFEDIVKSHAGFAPLPKEKIYRLADALQRSNQLSNSAYIMLKTIIGSAGESLICNCSNATLADRVGLNDTTQVSRAIRKLRDLGLIIVYDSGNYKRDGRFGLSVEILHIRHDELSQKIEYILEERRNRKDQKRAYQGDLRRVDAFMTNNELTEEQAHTLYEYKEMAKALVAEAKTVTSIVFAKARALMSRALQQVSEAIRDAGYIDETSCADDKNAMHLHYTTLNPIRICNDERKSANADHSNDKAPASGGMAYEKKPDVEIETCKEIISRHREAEISIEMVMQACPAIKQWASGPIRSWQDLVNQIDTLAVCCGINVSAVLEAKSNMGAKETALAVAIALQKSDLPDGHAMKVGNAGGYLRGMITKYADGRLRLSRSIFGLLRASPAI